MATVVVTFFLLLRFLFCKMDAEDGRERLRITSSRRGQRWSTMQPDKLEQLVKAMMAPVMAHGHCFDRDDAGLLEEYLTAAGLRLLEGEGVVPNYAEISMLLHSYVCNYSRKVDHVVHLAYQFSSELKLIYTEEFIEPDSETEVSPRRRRAASSVSDSGEFVPIVLTPAPLSSRRAPPPSGPPPALPRHYTELSTRDKRPDRMLYAYYGTDVIGSLDDFYVSRRTLRGHLVDDLEADEDEEAEEEQPSRPLSLLELQAAIERNAAGSPPPAPPGTPPPASPPASPPPLDLPPLHTSTPLPTPVRTRKRQVTITAVQSITLEIDVAMWRKMPAREFEVPQVWVRRVVRARRNTLLSVRRSLAASPAPADFRGFDTSWMDNGGFRGWARAEGSQARAAARRLSAVLLADSEDDGFFERSSDTPSPSLRAVYDVPETTQWEEEMERAAAMAAPLDLRALARDVRRALAEPPAAPAPVHWREMQGRVRRAQPKPSHVLLELMSKATSGEVVVLQGTPGLIGDFSVQLCVPRPPPAPQEEGPPPPDG